MADARSILLAFYAGFAGILLLEDLPGRKFGITGNGVKHPNSSLFSMKQPTKLRRQLPVSLSS
jgi:hypothetical protein